MWSADSDDLVDTLQATIETQALPFLHGIQSLADLIALAASEQRSGYPYYARTVAYASALEGKTDKALAALDYLLADLDHTYEWQVAMSEQAQLLRADLLADPAQAQRRLLAWEEETVKNLKLGAYR